ncbi:MAG: biotin--acetyl-CoA-carboxylase ligase [Desulfovibrio desulfuricans]|nr:biotin--acetyl-CoA-carboxylase ligase [Desulfovibrio desulfuricans]
MSAVWHNRSECESDAAAVAAPPPAHVWRFGTVTSCLDAAAHLADRGLLPPWGSVQAAVQTAGRGQLRRRWQSPPGNLYVALRLPPAPPFAGTEAAPAVGMLLAESLRAAGWPVLLKWPNDLVLCADGRTPGKVAGILLEERGGVLLAGVGVNVLWAPPRAEMRAEAALEAVCLGQWPRPGGRPLPTAEELWRCLVTRLHSAYSILRSSPGEWRKRAEALLLWRGRHVELHDGTRSVCGRLAGLGPSGGLLLECAGVIDEFFSGSLHLFRAADDAAGAAL